MSQLVARPGRNAARQAKKLKEIRKVKTAIQWHERERKKRQELKQNQWEAKQAVLQRIQWENENIKRVKKKALSNAKEDWKLGPLRPNRAFGPGAEKYGALTPAQIQKPEIPLKAHKNRNEVREKKGLELEYPLVVDDKKYFPIVKDDRVVILKGRDAGKIGTVREIVSRTHEIIVKDLNMQYYDSSVFSEAARGLAPKHESAVPIPLDHVRLVVPGEIIQGSTKRYGDVMVEKIFMERHTTGIDPYNGTDYGDAEVPKHHQYDPRTGLPIFNRYISGTQHRIEWPWERVEDELAETEAPEESPEERRTWRTTLTQPFTSLARWRSKNKEVESAKQGEQLSAAEKLQEIELEEQKKARDMVPRSQDPDLPHAYNDIDTTRNNVEALSVRYSLVSPPFPDTLGEELRSDIRDFSEKSRKDPDAPRASIKIPRNSEQGVLAREVAKAKHRAAEAMKTPMQLRWELEHKKKVDNLKKNPLVQEEELLAALGQHIQKSKAKPYKGKKQFTEPIQELD